jgi:hypothetical protein
MDVEASTLSSIHDRNYARLHYYYRPIDGRVIFQQNYVAQLPLLTAELPTG